MSNCLTPNDLLDPESAHRRNLRSSIESLSRLHWLGTRMASAILTFLPTRPLHRSGLARLGMLWPDYGLVPVLDGGGSDLDEPSTYADYIAVCTCLAVGEQRLAPQPGPVLVCSRRGRLRRCYLPREPGEGRPSFLAGLSFGVCEGATPAGVIGSTVPRYRSCRLEHLWCATTFIDTENRRKSV